ncbi:Signal recognition particle subunit SRP72 [Zancudomyces culisetae]|uniref:Signal recognition particle subunit SRP72 n=1 Tax=Zancudomyces culisetae TaxID=1213189 RepID=A0A1R1PXS8_ZANCU|nr:Signal recognition particle subunit SRP72 [Zancudomyces culisetae]|eukprot:OMH85763.1 Signal recognition particle subunit SRP72 [Zancudomyces culisetae]
MAVIETERQEILLRIIEGLKNKKYEIVVEECAKYNQEGRKEKKVVEILIKSLIKMGKYRDAIKEIDEVMEDRRLAKVSVGFEQGYCYFMLGEYEKAIEVVSKLSETEKVLHLKAQIYYKTEEYEKSIEIYERLREGEKGDTKQRDIDINIRASKAAKAQAGSLKEGVKEEDGGRSYEAIFNESFVKVRMGEYERAIEDLENAKKIAETELKEAGYLEEEIEEEVGMILGQIGYVAYLKGDKGQALRIWQQVAKQTGDVVAQAVSIANQTIVQLDKSRAAKHKAINKLNTIKNSKAYKQMMTAQKQVIIYNLARLYLSVGNGLKAKKLVQSDSNLAKTTDMEGLNAYNFETSQNAITKLVELAQREKQNVPLKYVYMALDLLSRKKSPQSKDVFQSIAVLFDDSSLNLANSIEYAPRISLLLRKLSKKHTSSSCDDLCSSFKRCLAKLPSFYSALSLFLLSNSSADSVSSLSSAFSLDSSNLLCAAYLYLVSPNTSTLSSSDSVLSKHLSSCISSTAPSSPLKSSIKFPSYVSSRVRYSTAKSSRKPPQKLSAKKLNTLKAKKRQRYRKNLLSRNPPHSLSQNKPVDQERWIPLHERSYYRPKKSRRANTNASKAASGGGTQGAVSAEAANALNFNSPKSQSSKKSKKSNKSKRR